MENDDRIKKVGSPVNPPIHQPANLLAHLTIPTHSI